MVTSLSTCLRVKYFEFLLWLRIFGVGSYYNIFLFWHYPDPIALLLGFYKHEVAHLELVGSLGCSIVLLHQGDYKFCPFSHFNPVLGVIEPFVVSISQDLFFWLPDQVLLVITLLYFLFPLLINWELFFKVGVL